MNNIFIRGVSFQNNKWSFSSPRFGNGLIIVEAPNGSGKTTFSDLIYFGLGGNVPQFNPLNKEHHKEITSDPKGLVTLNIEICGESFVLQRRLDERTILVIGKDGTVEQHPISRGTQSSSSVFSDWFVGKMDIPVFEVSVKSSQFKLNLTDLMRLMYYDQETPPRKIYRKNDLDNDYVDSADLRKMIFEVLTGKTTQPLHQAIAELRDLNREIDKTKSQMDIFADLNTRLSREDVNLEHLNRRRDELISEVDRLTKARDETKVRTKAGREIDPLITQLADELRRSQSLFDGLKDEERVVSSQMTAQQVVLQSLIEEITTIKKIILTNNTLGIFTPDTCPYCLREVQREKNKCICGKSVKEEEFERFFYSPDEYHHLLGSKAKNIDTLIRSKEDLGKKYADTKKRKDEAEQALLDSKTRLASAFQSIELGAQTGEIELISKTIAEKQVELQRTEDQIQLEQQRAVLNNELTALLNSKKSLQAKIKSLEASSGESMSKFVEKFSTFYSTLVTKSVKNCRTARIDDDYMPELDFGAYLESSAVVPRRLCYFFTLLRMSLEDPEVPYPRFILIDTPDQNGIDDANLIGTIRLLNEVTNSHTEDEYQVLLTTGIGQYPNEFKDRVILRLRDEQGGRLLQPTSMGAMQ
jgi:hypothetical protein